MSNDLMIQDGAPIAPFSMIEDAVLTEYPEMTPTILAVYVALKSFTHENRLSWRTSLEEIGARAHCSSDSVSRATAKLREWGLLTVTPQYRVREEEGGTRRPHRSVNTYTVYRPSHPAPGYEPHRAAHSEPAAMNRTERSIIAAAQSGSNTQSKVKANVHVPGGTDAAASAPRPRAVLPKVPSQKTKPMRQDRRVWAMVSEFASGIGIARSRMTEAQAIRAYDALAAIPGKPPEDDIRLCAKYCSTLWKYRDAGTLTPGNVAEAYAPWVAAGRPAEASEAKPSKQAATTPEERTAERRRVIDQAMREAPG